MRKKHMYSKLEKKMHIQDNIFVKYKKNTMSQAKNKYH